LSMCDDRHRHQEWLQFLRVIDQGTPAGKELHLIADNYATHKHAKVKRRLNRHPRFHVHFTPSKFVLSEYGGAVLPRPHAQPPPSRRLSRCRRVDHGDRRSTDTTRTPNLHLDRQGKRYLGESEARPEIPE